MPAAPPLSAGGSAPVSAATITIGLPPSFHLGPLPVAWHGLMIGVGLLAGGWLAIRYARERDLDIDRLQVAALILVVGGGIGARFYHLAQIEPAALIRPADWFGRFGFAFYGAIIVGVPATAIYLRRHGKTLPYLDAFAAGFPLGMAVGRIGDLILGEHYGPPTTAPWGFRYTDPSAAVPSSHLAYQSGAFYEILAALLIFGLLWPQRGRLRTPGLLLCLTVALYSAARFLIFFVIRDTDVVALGLRQAQLTSLALLFAAATGTWLLIRRGATAFDDGSGDLSSAALKAANSSKD